MKYFCSCILFAIALTQEVQSQIKFGGGTSAGAAVQSYTLTFDLTKTTVAKRRFDVDPYGAGFAVGAHGKLRITRWLSTRLSVDYMGFSAKVGKITDEMEKVYREARVDVQPGDLSSDGGFLSILDFALVGIGRLSTGTIVTPYALIGPSLCHDSAVDINLKIGSRTQDITIPGEWSVGLTYGIGSEFAFGKVTLFLEIKDVLNWVNGKTAGHSLFLVGITYNG